jgi:hypothetical protein
MLAGQRCQLTDDWRGRMRSKRRDTILIVGQRGHKAKEVASLACRGCLLAAENNIAMQTGCPDAKDSQKMTARRRRAVKVRFPILKNRNGSKPRSA